ncbi:MAG: peptide chain release factor 2 [Thermomicrobiales bacterium]
MQPLTSVSLPDLLDRLERIRVRLDLAHLEREIEDIERQSGEPGFWDDSNAAQRAMRALGDLKATVGDVQGLGDTLVELQTLQELAKGEPEFAGEVESEARAAGERLGRLELSLALNGPHDRSDAILVIHSGEGGIDAQDFAAMLSRMYLRWADRRNLKAELLDETTGEEAGIKNATIELKGPNAYGLVRGEAGSHRLVRQSPFDSAHRRHTAFALVEVLPELEGQSEITINPDDVRMDVFRASGAGGQHVNKTSSAVRLTHVPTGIVVTCQNERSQIQNRETAHKILGARLLERQMKAEAEERTRLKGDIQAAGFGNRIRSYVLHPYTQVTDHRTETSVGDANGVLDGALDPFIDAYLEGQMGVEQDPTAAGPAA